MTSSIMQRIFILIRKSFVYLLDLDSDDLPHSAMARHNGHSIDVCGEIEHRLGRIAAEKYTLNKEKKKISVELNGFSEKSEFAVEIGRDDLAKAALSLKAHYKQELNAIERRVSILNTEADELADLVSKLGDKPEIDASIFRKVEELEHLINNNSYGNH